MHALRFGFAALALAAAAPAAAQSTVTVTVAGVTQQRGNVMIALYTADAWSGGAPVATARVPVGAGGVTAALVAPAPGRYGVKLFHDVNGDGKMDANVMGLPTEPIGFSNDAPVRLGPPSFADAGFDVGANGAAQTITLK